MPDGYRHFRRIEHLYRKAPNNAVLGSEAGHPFLHELIARMSAFPRADRRVRYALGTHLLQGAVRDWSGPGLTVLPPETFFPLGPEISEHWFRVRPEVRLAEVIGSDTLVVHCTRRCAPSATCATWTRPSSSPTRTAALFGAGAARPQSIAEGARPAPDGLYRVKRSRRSPMMAGARRA